MYSLFLGCTAAAKSRETAVNVETGTVTSEKTVLFGMMVFVKDFSKAIATVIMLRSNPDLLYVH
jgi:hypothetical protein